MLYVLLCVHTVNRLPTYLVSAIYSISILLSVCLVVRDVRCDPVAHLPTVTLKVSKKLDFGNRTSDMVPSDTVSTNHEERLANIRLSHRN
jgi:hypothetical protein